MNNILIIYLGSQGGGVLATYEIYESLCRVGKNKYSLMISSNNPFKERYLSLSSENIFIVDTHQREFKSFLYHTILPHRIIRIIQIVKKLRPSIIFFTMDHPWIVIITYYVKMFLPGTRIVYLKHNPQNFESVSSSIFNYMLDILSRRMLYKSDFVFTLSKYVKDMIVENYNVPSDKIYSFSLGSHYSLCKDNGWRHNGFFRDGKLRILFFGRILKYKGIDILVNAFEMMRHEGFPVQLTIAGEGIVDEHIREKIKSLGITFLNYWIEDEKLCDLLKDTDVIILPYTAASQSGPASIALAMEIPVIATKVGGLVEQVYDGVNGILIEPNSPKEIVRAIKKIINSPQLLNSFSAGARTLKENQLSWRNIAKSMDEVFSEIVATSVKQK